jgi:hypothetical protein
MMFQFSAEGNSIRPADTKEHEEIRTPNLYMPLIRDAKETKPCFLQTIL